MTFPTINTPVTTATGGSVTTINVNMPATVNTGQRLMMLVTFQNSSGTAISTPSGWALLGSNFTQVASAVYEKKSAAGTEGGTTVAVTFTGTATLADAISWTVDGSDTATASSISAVVTGNATNAPDPASLTPSFAQGDTLWIALESCRASAVVSAYPTNYSLAQTSVTGAGLAARQLNAATENPGAFTIGANTQWAAWTLGVPTAPVSSIVRTNQPMLGM